MALLKILTYPHPFLRRQAVPVTVFDEKLKKLSEDMFETMKDAEGIGLAATQVGYGESIFVMNVPIVVEEEGNEESQDNILWEPLTIINPEIVEKSGSIVMEEGCLSIPGIKEEVTRSSEIKVNYRDLENNFIERTFHDLKAVCFQHELDHLNGKLFIDRLPMLKREFIKKKIKKTQ